MLELQYWKEDCRLKPFTDTNKQPNKEASKQKMENVVLTLNGN